MKAPTLLIPESMDGTIWNSTVSMLTSSRLVPPPIQGPFSDLSAVSVDFSEPEVRGSGGAELAGLAGRLVELVARCRCRRFLSDLSPVSYLYFRVHDSFRWVGTRELEVKVWMEKTSDGLPDLSSMVRTAWRR